VSMIRAAHVGIGVMGQEGMQAVRSADYSVQQFSHLGRLLLYHGKCRAFLCERGLNEALTRTSSLLPGRLSYLRTTQCIDYFLYKNIVFTLPQFIYGTASAFSGQVQRVVGLLAWLLGAANTCVPFARRSSATCTSPPTT
jgi:magnesium-transporting ATPase (P-type)